MHSWFTIENIDGKTFSISEYGHWEQVHSYLLIGNEYACLIDTGLGIGNIDKVVKELTNLPVKAITTHVHWDHIGGHKYFEDVYVHKDDSNWLKQGIPIPLDIIRNNVIKEPLTKPVPQNFNIEEYFPYIGNPTKELKDKDIIDLGNRRLEVIHTPGHSQGGFKVAKTKAIIGKEYMHYKGGLYKVINMATHTETEETLVIYQGVETNKTWARPKEMFEDTIELDGKIINRFQQLT